MVFCMYCGAEISDDAAYCYKCGKKLQFPATKNENTDDFENEAAPNNEEVFGKYILYQNAPTSPNKREIVDNKNNESVTVPQLNQREAQEQSVPASAPYQTNSQDDDKVLLNRGMKWHYFNATFMVLLWIILNVIAILGLIFSYFIRNDEVYSFDFNEAPELYIFIIFIILIEIAFIYFLAITRKSLLRFERRGPRRLLICTAIICLLHFGIYHSAQSMALLVLSVIYLLMLIFNAYYYYNNADNRIAFFDQ